MLKRILLVILLINLPLLALAQAQPSSSDEPVIYLTPDDQSANVADNSDEELIDNDDSAVNTLKPATPPVVQKPTIYGPTTKEDHILSLAKKLRPDEHVTLQQTMIALLHKNPNAFLLNNVNGLKSGQLLEVPTASQIDNIPADLAQALVIQQNHEWQKIQLAALEKAKEKKHSTPVVVAVKQKSETKILQPIPPQYSEQAAYLSGQYEKKITALQKQLVNKEKDFAQYQQTMTARLDKLQQQNLVDEAELKLAPPPKILQPVAANPNVEINKENQKPSVLTYLLPKNKVSWWILWTAIFAIVLIWIPYRRREKIIHERQEPVVHLEDAIAIKPEQPKIQEKEKTEEEYDFMSSQEAIPAKLDLARAYIDMEDIPSAKSVLDEVIAKGNEAEVKEAKKILRKIKSNVLNS